MKLSLNQRIFIGITLIILLIPAMYLTERVSKERAVHSGAIIQVIDEPSGKLVALMGVDVLKALAKQEFPGDPNVKGPTLVYAVGSSGLSGYKRIEVKGLKEKKGFQIDKEALGKNLVLALNGKTVSLLDLNNPGRFLVEDVSEISKVD